MSKKSLLILIVFFVFVQSLFSQINVLNPMPGNWANKQVLLIDTNNSEAAEYFYSVDGSSPKEFGFAYDGPVLLDKIGKVNLKIAKVSNEGIEELSIDYNVQENDGFNTQYESLINSFLFSGILNCSAGSSFVIPNSLQFRFGNEKSSFIKGQELSLSKNLSVSSYIPCELFDSEKSINWRFVVKTIPQSLGIYSRRDVPFVIEDWEKITFTNENFIYKIDDGMWQLPKEPLYLDRTKNHIVYWQSIAYEQGNPIEYFDLPAKPTLNVQVFEDGNYIYSLIGDDSYSLGIQNDNNAEVNELFKEVGIDTFIGHRLSGHVNLQVYSNSIYQGTFFEEYDVNKLLPETPFIQSSEKSFYSRKKVDIEILSSKKSDLYVSVSKPFVISDVSKAYSENDDIFKNVEFEEYKKVNENFKISFVPNEKNVEYYKIRAYFDNGKYKSLVSEYSVILDSFNYFFDSELNVENADGTLQKPFSSFSQALDLLNKSRYAVLKIKGNLKMPQNSSILQTNCVIENLNNAVLIFPAESSLIVKNSTLEIENCVIKNELYDNSESSRMIPIIKMENGVLTLKDCEVITSFAKNGNVFEGYNSVINFSNVIASARANFYISLVSGTKNRINIQNSTLTCGGETSILISLNNSMLSCSNNTFRVSGKRGRVVELFAVEGNINKNKVYVDFDLEKSSFSPFYFDKKSKVQLTDNEIN